MDDAILRSPRRERITLLLSTGRITRSASELRANGSLLLDRSRDARVLVFDRKTLQWVLTWLITVMPLNTIR